MSYTAPNALPYRSASFPIETRKVTVKRGDGATAGGGTAATVGEYLFEGFNTSRPATMVDRQGIYGEGKGEPTVVRQPITFTATAQIDLATTNEIKPGDFFEEIIDVDSGAVSALKVRFIIGSCDHNRQAGTPHTFSLSGSEDMQRSSQYGGA
jgi:hypothetical protein